LELVGNVDWSWWEIIWGSICLVVVLGVHERRSCVYRVMQEGRSMCWEVVVSAVVREIVILKGYRQTALGVFEY